MKGLRFIEYTRTLAHTFYDAVPLVIQLLHSRAVFVISITDPYNFLTAFSTSLF